MQLRLCNITFPKIQLTTFKQIFLYHLFHNEHATEVWFSSRECGEGKLYSFLYLNFHQWANLSLSLKKKNIFICVSNTHCLTLQVCSTIGHLLTLMYSVCHLYIYFLLIFIAFPSPWKPRNGLHSKTENEDGDSKPQSKLILPHDY